MRSEGFRISIDKMPTKARLKSDSIKKTLQYAFLFGFNVNKVDYKSGLVQLKYHKVKLNWYLSTNSIVLIRNGKSKGLKRKTPDEIRKLIYKLSED